MVLNIALTFATKDDIMTLAVTNLRMGTNYVSSCLTNNSDITMAMLDVLTEWNKSQKDKKTAYQVLYKALETAKMSAQINGNY